MIKELQALNDLRNSGLVKDDVVCFTKKAFEKRLDIIEKYLKALEIIKEKEVNVFIFLHSGDLETYNDMVEDNRKPTQEEFNLLKEVIL